MCLVVLGIWCDSLSYQELSFFKVCHLTTGLVTKTVLSVVEEIDNAEYSCNDKDRR